MAEPTTAPTRPLKAVAYVRVSTDRQSEEGFGLSIQREAVRRWGQNAFLRRRGHSLDLFRGDESGEHRVVCGLERGQLDRQRADEPKQASLPW